MAENYLLIQYQDIVLAVLSNLTREVVELHAFTPLPGGQGGLAGLSLVGGSAVPLLDLHRLLGLPRHKTSLGLLVSFNQQSLLLPIDQVIGNLNSETSLMTNEPLSSPQEAEDLRIEGKIRVINPEVLIATLQARSTPV